MAAIDQMIYTARALAKRRGHHPVCKERNPGYWRAECRNCGAVFEVTRASGCEPYSGPLDDRCLGSPAEEGA